MIADIAQTSKIVVEKSTVPVKAAESVSTILRTNHKKGVKYQVGSDWKYVIFETLYWLIFDLGSRNAWIIYIFRCTAD